MAKKKILLVDDEPSVLKIVTRRLELNHYEVITATDGLEGLDRAMTDKPDLIISDIMMPNMDGYTFIRKVRSQPALARTPVIILTAKDRMQDLFLFQGVKDCDYIVKPFESDHLLQKISELLARVDGYLGPGASTPPPPAA
jgi:DNA-binding response OmpR family regulator